jgi:DNA helicase HerA-like ATPase
MKRYIQGVESGAFFYQMFLTCPDRESLLGAAGLLKSSFWGAGTDADRLPQPFHTITEFEDGEAGRLLQHAKAFTQYRKREAVMEVVEQHHFSSYVTPTEMAAFCHPPTAEMPGIKAMVDSMPVLAIPYDRQNKDIHLGRVVNGERAEVSNIEFGLDVDEITHTLIAGTTGIGKTTTLLTMLAEISRVKRQIIEPASIARPVPSTREVRAGILGLDWANNMRNLASVVDPDRFRFYSIANPELGAFRWNPLAVPDEGMNPVEWAGDLADNMTISFNLGEFGRSLIAEILSDLYSANRLEDFVLRPEVRDPNSNQVLREGIVLGRLDRAELPKEAIEMGVDGHEVANVLTYPALSRLISMSHLATLVLAKVEEAATVEGARLHGPAFRDRIQSLWRRVSYFAPGSMFANVFACDEHLDERTTLGVRDLVDPERGLVTIIEAEGLDLTNRRFVLGSVLLAVWSYGQYHGQGCFDQNGAGPGTFVCLEEAHELFGDQGRDEDAFSAATRTALYESMFRRARALGMKLIAVVQNCGAIPSAVTSNTTTVMIHRQYDDNDRKRAFSLLNWDHMVNAHLREWRYLGEMARGYLIVRLDAKESYLESTPYQIMVDPAAIAPVSDPELLARAGSLSRR